MKSLIKPSIGTLTAMLFLVIGIAEATASDLVFHEARVILTHEQSLHGAGYLTIRNDSGQDDRLIKASCNCASRVEIHTMTMDGDIMRMRPVSNGLEIPAGQEISLHPGGLHLMLIGMKSSPSPLIMTLIFERVGEVRVPFVQYLRAESHHS
ncbi:MAG: copper chaperone PCu(A)C [Pseudomonadota bacterium]